MRAALLFSSLAWIAGAALAQVHPQAPSHPAPAVRAEAPASTPALERVAEKKGKRRAHRAERAARRAQPAPSDTDALSGCLALWEPATHMTRGEWSRACRRVAERLRDTTLR